MLALYFIVQFFVQMYNVIYTGLTAKNDLKCLIHLVLPTCRFQARAK